MWITRKYIQEHEDTIFVFGDNVEGYGNGGQAAEARGENNVIGIPTKWSPREFFKDEDYDKVIPIIDAAFQQIKYQLNIMGFNIVFFPDIGKGLAELPKRAPKIYQYIKDKIESF